MATAAIPAPAPRPECSWWDEELRRLEADLPALPPSARAALARTIAAMLGEVELPQPTARSARLLLERLEAGRPLEQVSKRAAAPARFSARVGAAVVDGTKAVLETR